MSSAIKVMHKMIKNCFRYFIAISFLLSFCYGELLGCGLCPRKTIPIGLLVSSTCLHRKALEVYKNNLYNNFVYRSFHEL